MRRCHGPRKKGSPLLRLFRTAAICFSVAAIATLASAQSTFGTLRGTVQDPSGAIIPGAQITLHSLAETSDRTLTTNTSGEFSLETLQPGRYRVTVRQAGFADTVMESITLAARQDLRLPVTLSLASSSEVVTVQADAASINTEDATLGDEKSNGQLMQLPLNNRASSTSPLGALSLSSNVQQDSQGNINVGDASASMVNFSVDGISTANVRSNGALQDAYPSQEWIAAMKVTAFNNSAEFSQLGDVTFVTKSGSNAFHGSLFEYLQNDALDAAPYGFSGKARSASIPSVARWAVLSCCRTGTTVIREHSSLRPMRRTAGVSA